jgi:hypothetical protein
MTSAMVTPNAVTGAGRRRDRHRRLAVLGLQAGGDLGEDQVLGGLTGVGVVGQHLPGRVQPARVGPGQRLPPASPAVVSQPGRAVLREVLDPAAQGGCPTPISAALAA